ncbi:Protein OSB3, chloroplastic/mitochondrial [Cardamine amara subsp. amara]|uniref:Protein OSB3, chloroplastic/mitochondrial n=1 Tax=Cardamine amara subsp. amara TaxID=228776 RepID=A0ABD1C3D3_CARAN
MNLISRTLTRVVSSSLYHSRATKLQTPKWIISHQIRFYAANFTGKSGGGESKPWAKASDFTAEKELTPPKEIEFKPEISNWINLTGFVEQPVQSGPCSEGKFWAGTVISQRSDSKSSAFWIPIIFEGDLAKMAAHHIKKDDRIHVSGKLFIDSPPPNVTYPQSNVQVMVQSLNFIQASSPASSPETVSQPEKEEFSTKKLPARSKKYKVIDEETSNSWKHLLENPKEWWDYRGNKANGLVKPRHPDFKSMVGDLSLWLTGAPDWVLPNLEGLEFAVLVPKGKLKQLKGEESWKDLVQNPDKWFDSRSDKTNVKAPDFKHKETGEALWLTDSPTWVLSKLPPRKKNQERPLESNTVSQPQLELDVAVPKGNLKQLKREESWKNMVENPNNWWDNRTNKRNPKGPDFTNKETGEALWLNGSPTWVQPKLPPQKTNQERPLVSNNVSQPQLELEVAVPKGNLKQIKREESWKNLVENPNNWWDNRTNKRNPKGPDFTNKETGEALWLNGSPTWVQPKLPPLKTNQERPVMAS